MAKHAASEGFVPEGMFLKGLKGTGHLAAASFSQLKGTGYSCGKSQGIKIATHYKARRAYVSDGNKTRLQPLRETGFTLSG